VSDDVLDQLEGASPRRLLDELARIGCALAKNQRPRPEVELFLGSGQVIRGRIITVADDRHAGAVALVHVGGHVRQPAVTYVRVDHVAAVGVGDASLLVRAPVIDAPAPSRLELQRQIAARADGLHAKLGRPVKIDLASGDLDDDARRAIGAVVPLLFEVLLAIASDAMGKEALVPIERIELAAAPAAEVVAEIVNGSRGFLIRAPKLLTEQLTHQTLRSALEKQL
jgi:hypothetical protein